MATIAVQSLETTGLTFVLSAASSGLADKFSNDGKTLIYIKNGNGDAKKVIIASAFSPLPKGVALADSTIDLGATVERMAGPFEPGIWNDSSGYVNLTYATHTALSLAVISLNT